MTKQEKQDFENLIQSSSYPEYLKELIEKYSIKKYNFYKKMIRNN